MSAEEPRAVEHVAVREADCCVCGRKIRPGQRMITILHRGLVETSHVECPAAPSGGTAADRMLNAIRKELP